MPGLFGMTWQLPASFHQGWRELLDMSRLLTTPRLSVAPGTAVVGDPSVPFEFRPFNRVNDDTPPNALSFPEYVNAIQNDEDMESVLENTPYSSYRNYSVAEATQIIKRALPNFSLRSQAARLIDLPAIANLIRFPSVMSLFIATFLPNEVSDVNHLSLSKFIFNYTANIGRLHSAYRSYLNNPGEAGTGGGMEIVHNMQNIWTVAMYFKILAVIVHKMEPSAEFRCRLTFAIRYSTIDPATQQPEHDVMYTKWPSATSGGNAFYVVTPGQDVREIMESILEEPTGGSSTRTLGSKPLEEDHDYMVSDVNWWIFVPPNAHSRITDRQLTDTISATDNAVIPVAPGARTRTALTVSMRRVLLGLFARAPHPNRKFYKHLAEASRLSTRPLACVLETFFYNYLTRDVSNHNKRIDQTRQRVNIFPDERYRELVTKPFIEQLKYLYDYFRRQGRDMIPLRIAFFSGFGKTPFLPPMEIVYANEDPDEPYKIEVLPDIRHDLPYSAEEQDKFPIVLYYNGHTVPSTISSYETAVHMSQATAKREENFIFESPPTKFALKSIDLQRERDLEQRRRDRSRRARQAASEGAENESSDRTERESGSGTSHRRPVQPAPIGTTVPYHGHEVFCYDFETFPCARCSLSRKGAPHHPILASIAWGTRPHEVICFHGSECPCLYEEDPLYRGCAAKLVEWLLQHGYYDVDAGKSHPSSSLRDLYLYSFNGASFDNFFLMKALQVMGLRPQITMSGSKMMMMHVGNLKVFDFRLLYGGGSLAGIFKLFAGDTAASSSSNAPHLPADPKWSCYPYQLLQPDLIGQTLSMEELLAKGPEIWGGKRASVIPFSEDAPLEVVNCEWWSRNINDAGYTLQDAENYCNYDSTILYYCVAVHHLFKAQGVMNERLFDVSHCPTLASSCITKFQQSFLQHDLQAPPPDFDVKIKSSFHTFDIYQLFKDAYKGGDTQMYETTLEENMYADINSSYPHSMEANEMPTNLTGVICHDRAPIIDEDYDELDQMPYPDFFGIPRVILPHQADAIVKHHLYVCDIEYPENMSDTLIKCDNFCLSLNRMPAIYYDNTSKRHRLGAHFGVELLLALRKGAKVSLYREYTFDAENIFKDYMNTHYRIRVELGDAKSYDTFERIPGKEPDPFMKFIMKLYMNTLYGRLGMAWHFDTVIIYAFEMMRKYEFSDIMDMTVMPGATMNETYLQLSLKSDRSNTGAFTHIAAYVTALSRVNLNTFKYEIEKLPQEQDPDKLLELEPFVASDEQEMLDSDNVTPDSDSEMKVRVAYGDTDSTVSTIPKRHSRRTRRFRRKWMHNHLLGKFKIEDFFRRAYLAGKKTYALRNSKSSHHDEYRAKGVPRRSITADQIQSLVEQSSSSLSVPMGVTFKHSPTTGVLEMPSFNRKIQAANHTRYFYPDSTRSRPFRDLEEFREAGMQRKMLKRLNSSSSS